MGPRYKQFNDYPLTYVASLASTLFQIEYRDPSDIRKGFRFKSASGCHIASTFFLNKPPSDKENNATTLRFQGQRTGTTETVQEGAKADQFIGADSLLEANSKDRIAETLRRTTLIGCTFGPKLEISTFKIVDEATRVGRVSSDRTSPSSPSLKLNRVIELLSAQVRMRIQLQKRTLSCAETPKLPTTEDEGIVVNGTPKQFSYLYCRELVIMCVLTLGIHTAITGSGYFVE
ncbi:hypothetical protein TWF102_008861 [Orbilia oligospora]|uniref:Uncharacterized protein n=1 Tax=Orbilia oligospora TaxID=2813651 RepID=A0A7C8N1I6_ORBOL|nr:hypothetical protein TWF102_008861 [Orbilia oligospora]KAF3111167.1 hypothetical protein TWF103_003849 [Orbilia oligospora]KAF3115661.1 hypothetical protein TWF706_005775 [Orbilia oligospora]